jgi:hypothetical protein
MTNTSLITVLWNHFDTVHIYGNLPFYTNSICSLVVELQIHTIMNFICSQLREADTNYKPNERQNSEYTLFKYLIIYAFLGLCHC